jgi:hypothetical protein
VNKNAIIMPLASKKYLDVPDRDKNEGIYTKKRMVYYSTKDEGWSQAVNLTAACFNILAARSNCFCASSHLPSAIASRTAGKKAAA